MMNIEEYKNVWVFIETEHGKAKNVSLELLNQGKILANANNEKIIGVIIGKNMNDVVKSVVAYGADEVILVEGEEYKDYNTDGYTNVMTKLVKKHKPSVILIGATINGRDLGPRVACRLETGLTADCTGLDIDEDTRAVAWTRPAFGGNLMATILCADTRPQIGTVRPGVFKKVQPDNTKTANVIREEVPTPAEDIRTKIIDFIKVAEEQGVKLEEAEIIVSGGRGLEKLKTSHLLEN